MGSNRSHEQVAGHGPKPVVALLRTWHWLFGVVLLAVSLWAGNVAIFNWWAAGGPPTPQADLFRSRGNMFFVLAAGFFSAAVVLVFIGYLRFRANRSKPRCQ